MASAVEIAEAVSYEGIPLLFVDTCSILDIIRGAGSSKQMSVAETESALAIARLATSTPPGCRVIRASVVEGEFNKHLQSAVNILDTEIKKVSASLNILDSLARATGLSPLTTRPDPFLSDPVKQLAQFIIDNALICDSDQDSRNAAHHRVSLARAPSKPGKESYKDCCLLEEYLAVMREVRSRNGNVPAVLITSNTADFCDEHRKVHPHILSDASSLDLSVCINWQHARWELLRSHPTS